MRSRAQVCGTSWVWCLGCFLSEKNWHLLKLQNWLFVGLTLLNVNIALHTRIIQVIYSNVEKAATTMSCSLFTTDLNRSAFRCSCPLPLSTHQIMSFIIQRQSSVSLLLQKYEAGFATAMFSLKICHLPVGLPHYNVFLMETVLCPMTLQV